MNTSLTKFVGESKEIRRLSRCKIYDIILDFISRLSELSSFSLPWQELDIWTNRRKVHSKDLDRDVHMLGFDDTFLRTLLHPDSIRKSSWPHDHMEDSWPRRRDKPDNLSGIRDKTICRCDYNVEKFCHIFCHTQKLSDPWDKVILFQCGHMEGGHPLARYKDHRFDGRAKNIQKIWIDFKNYVC